MGGLLPPVTDPRVTPHGCASWRNLEVRIATVAAGRYISPPWPASRLMVHLGPPARMACRVDGIERTCLQAPGDLHIIPAGAEVVWDDEDPTRTMSVWFSPALLAAAGEGMRQPARHARLEPHLQFRDIQLVRLARLLRTEMDAGPAGDPLFAESLGLTLAGRVLRRYGAAEPLSLGSTLSKPQLRLVLDYIDAHLEEDLQVVDLAALTSRSPSHFRALFRRTVGQSVHQFVIARRVARARALLETGDVSVTEAAADCGFCHPSHLARSMRQVLGLTPSQLLRNRAA